MYGQRRLKSSLGPKVLITPMTRLVTLDVTNTCMKVTHSIGYHYVSACSWEIFFACTEIMPNEKLGENIACTPGLVIQLVNLHWCAKIKCTKNMFFLVSLHAKQ